MSLARAEPSEKIADADKKIADAIAEIAVADEKMEGAGAKMEIGRAKSEGAGAKIADSASPSADETAAPAHIAANSSISKLPIFTLRNLRAKSPGDSSSVLVTVLL